MRAQRLLSNAGTFTFAVPAERSGRASPALTRATRQFQAGRGPTVDGHIAKSGETLRGLDTTLFAADKNEEEFPEEPPKDEKPKDPEKDNKKQCASLAQDLANAKINEKETGERFRAANEGMIGTREKIANLEEKLGISTRNTSLTGATKGALEGAVSGARTVPLPGYPKLGGTLEHVPIGLNRRVYI